MRSALAQQLPEYMIPAAFVPLQSWPLTSSGKLDRRALPAPELMGSATLVAPTTPHEALLCRLFTELTGVRRVSADDSFFALGGHSLLAMRLVAQVRETTGLTLPLRAVFAQPTPQGLGQVLDAAERSQLPAVLPGSGSTGVEGAETAVVLSWGQERLWTLDRLEGGSSQYNIPWAMELLGPLDQAALLAAIRALVIRHAPLRTLIRADAGAPVGRLLPADALGTLVVCHDLSGLQDTGEERDAALAAHLSAVADHRFALASAASVYGRLLHLGPEHHLLAMVVHHAAADGSSLPVLLRELAALYAGEALADLPYDYADYAQWQRTGFAQCGTLERGLDYWREQLADAPALLTLPLDHPRRADRARRAGYVELRIPPALGRALATLAAAEGVTLFSLLLTAWGLLLGRLARQEDVVIGTPVAGRLAPGSEALVGFFVNTLALRLDLSGTPDRSSLLLRVQAQVSEALEHQETPFEQVVSALDLSRSLAHTPLFQVMFAWQSQESTAWVLPGLEVHPRPLGLSQAKFDLTLSLQPAEAGAILGGMEFDADLFEQASLSAWAQMLLRLLQGLVDSPAERPLALIDLLGDEEHQQLAGFNLPPSRQDDPRVPDLPLLPALFARAAAAHPQAIALVCGEAQLSYAELDAASNRLARFLITQGAGPERIVAICRDRSIPLVVAILGVMKSGAAYLPLDPEHPPERLRQMLADSRAMAVLCGPDQVPLLEGTVALFVTEAAETAAAIAEQPPGPISDAERTNPLRPGHLAY
ncbi:MAG: condensation domain-containing protein, partial [Gammaproteobacteria bacterium SHHR-1]